MIRSFLFLLIAVQLACSVAQIDLPEAVGFQAGNLTLGSCSYQATCSVGRFRKTEGVCVSISAGCCSGTATSNLCPGSNDIKCCTNNHCSTPYGTGTCMQKSACSGKSYSGYCIGPSDLQCCVTSSPPPPPTPTSSNYGVDVSATISTSAASCFHSNSISFVIPRGYRSSGSVDPNVCTSIINAANAGIKTRDTYMFPCKQLFPVVLISTIPA